jgi:hypothetical protein
MIDIINKNFQNARIDEHVLDNMIVSNKLIAFYRSNEWVVVGKDAVREHHTYYCGEERRRITYGSDFCMK